MTLNSRSSCGREDQKTLQKYFILISKYYICLYTKDNIPKQSSNNSQKKFCSTFIKNLARVLVLGAKEK